MLNAETAKTVAVGVLITVLSMAIYHRVVEPFLEGKANA